MVSEREAAKQAASNREDEDPELTNALTRAHSYQLDLKKEDNRHAEAINQQNLGWIGNIIGDGKSVPTIAALATIFLTVLLAGGLYVAMIYNPEYGDAFSTQAERSLAVAGAALAYVFGKGGK